MDKNIGSMTTIIPCRRIEALQFDADLDHNVLIPEIKLYYIELSGMYDIVKMYEKVSGNNSVVELEEPLLGMFCYAPDEEKNFSRLQYDANKLLPYTKYKYLGLVTKNNLFYRLNHELFKNIDKNQEEIVETVFKSKDMLSGMEFSEITDFFNFLS